MMFYMDYLIAFHISIYNDRFALVLEILVRVQYLRTQVFA